jgi:hypothetical protein
VSGIHRIVYVPAIVLSMILCNPVDSTFSSQSSGYPAWIGRWIYEVSSPYAGGSATLKFDTTGTFNDDIYFVGMNNNRRVSCSGTWRDLGDNKIEKTWSSYWENGVAKNCEGKKDTLDYRSYHYSIWYVNEYGFSLELKRPTGPYAFS